MKISKPRNLTYLGRRAVQTEVTHNKNLRASIVEWIDDACVKNGGHKAGTVTIKVCSGDARKGTLVVHTDIVYIGDFAVEAATELVEAAI